MITISVCMIVKNEENILARGLNCIKDIADEIIIVDTGSTDRTKEIAYQYTNKVYDFEWVNDFSAARNYSFSKATMDYIYVADADEIIDEENQTKLKILKEALLPEIEIVQMKYTNQLYLGTSYNYDVEYRPKLYKRTREFRWVDPIHETVELNPVIYDSEIEIIHMPEDNHAKRDFMIFQKAIKDGERLSKKLFDLYARELYITGTDSDFIEALDYFNDTLLDETRDIDEIKSALCVLARAYRIKNDVHNFFKNCIKNVAITASSEVCYELGEYYFNLEDYKEAIIWYHNAAFESESSLSIQYSKDLPLKKLTKCFTMIGEPDKAIEYEKLVGEWKE